MREESKERLIKHLLFLEGELKDFPLFVNLSWGEYKSDNISRRNVERWIENLVNSSIDISKVILASEDILLPETYKEIVTAVSIVKGFDKENIEKLSSWVRLRNILTHWYLDIKWFSIERFVSESEIVYSRFVEDVKRYIRERL